MVKRMSKFPIIVCDDDKDLANQMAKNIKASIQDLTDDNNGYAELEESVTFVANDFAQAVGYVVANDIKNGIYFLDIELSRESKAKNGVDLAERIAVVSVQLTILVSLCRLIRLFNVSKKRYVTPSITYLVWVN